MKLYYFIPAILSFNSLFSQTDSVYVNLPEYIYTTTSSKYSVYYQNLIRAEFESKENIVVDCAVGYTDSMKYNLDSLQAGMYDMKIRIYDSLGIFIEQDSSKITVTDNSIVKNDTLKVMFIGDSFTEAGIYLKYVKDLYADTTGNPIKLLGTNSNLLYPYWGADNGIFHEGYSGHSWDWFANYTPSPFVFDEYEGLDFNRYFTDSLKSEKPDIVVIFLGLCNMQMTDPYSIGVIDNLISSFFAETKMPKLVNSLNEAVPEAMIGIVLIPPPNEREYTFTDPDYFESKVMNHRLGERYEDFFREYNSNMSVIPVSSNIDTYSGFGEDDGYHPNRDGYMQIAHSINGWIKYQITQMTGIQENDHSIPEYELSQNYPNPFNPVTTISYALPQASHVELNVYNLQGQLVQSLVNCNQDKGFHRAEFNADFFPSGIYLYSMKLDGEVVQSRKMILVK